MTEAPRKPASLPEQARWDPKDEGFEWVEGEVDENGERHGPYRCWNKEGVLHGVCTYVHGKVEGKNINYHPDGSVSSEGDWKDGVCMDAVYFRAKGESPEPFPEAVESVTEAHYLTRDGKTNYTIRYYNAEGREVLSTGDDPPPRPDSVSPDARYFPDMEMWVNGCIERRTNNQVGKWQWWSTAGVLRRVEERDDKGEALQVVAYHEDGTLELREQYDPEGVRLVQEKFHDNGKPFVTRKKNADKKTIYEAYWTDEGTLKKETSTEWSEDAIAGRRELGWEGRLRFEAKQHGDALACTLYGDGDEVWASGALRDGKLAGVWQVFDQQGAERRTLDMEGLELEAQPTHERIPWRLYEAAFTRDELPAPPEVEDISKIDWAEVESCYGRAGKIPDCLRGLVSEEPFVRNYALGTIEGETLHQGSIYEATARVVPFFVRFLANPQADRLDLLSMLFHWGSAAVPYAQEAREARDAGEEEDWVTALLGTLEGISDGWPTIWGLMGDASPEEKEQILLLAQFVSEGATVRDDVRGFAADKADARLRACAVDALASLDGTEANDLVPFYDDDPLIAATAAIATGLNFGPGSPPEAGDALSDVMERWGELADRYHDLPFVDTHILALLSLSAGSVRSERTRQLVKPLCQVSEEINGMSGDTYGRGLCALAFGSGDRPFAHDFIDVLETLARSKKFWVFDVNAREVLDAWNLPRDTDGLEALAKELRAADDPEAAMHEKMHAG